MNKIFCLETEWDQSMHDLKKKSTVLPLLDFLENAINIEYTFRQVAQNLISIIISIISNSQVTRPMTLSICAFMDRRSASVLLTRQIWL